MSSQASPSDLSFGAHCEQPAATILAEELWPGSHIEGRDRFSAIDFDVLDDGNQRVAFIEVKRRRVAHDAYPDTAVHWNKYLAARNFLRYYNVRTVGLVVFEDRVGYFYLDEVPDRKEHIARADRDGVGYPHAFYDLSRFIWLDDSVFDRMKALAGAE